MLDDSIAKQNLVVDTEHFDIPATTNLVQSYDITRNKDYNINYMILDFLFTGETDEPTEVEKLAKLGTFGIETKGTGQWQSALQFDDAFHNSLARLGKQNSYIIGDGGGDNDLHGLRIILDAGGKLLVNNKLGWSSELEAVLKITYIADAGLDGSSLDITRVGYRGKPPSHVRSVQHKAVTLPAQGNLEKFDVNAGDILQEFFAFATTELNLATIQNRSDWAIQNLQVRPNDQEDQKKILCFVNQMLDGIDDGGEQLLQQYLRRDFDLGNQGIGIRLNQDDKIAVVSGVAEVIRMWISTLQPVVTTRNS